MMFKIQLPSIYKYSLFPRHNSVNSNNLLLNQKKDYCEQYMLIKDGGELNSHQNVEKKMDVV